jgi:hypothetical protein
MATVTVAYNPNDFFYATSYNTPSDDICTNLLQNDAPYSQCTACYGVNVSANVTANLDGNTYTGTNGNVYINSCDTGYWNDMSSNCFKYQLCKNKKLATLANNVQNQNGGSDERYANTKKEYDYAVLHTINIVTGIIILGGVTYYYFIKK